jgi:hypothetical protein
MPPAARALAFVVACFALPAGPVAPGAQTAAPAPWRIDVKATPIERFDRLGLPRQRFGALEFRGGMVLTSDEERFGGFSGLRVEADGERFLAITDRGYWLRGRVRSDGDRPLGIADAEMAPILGADGRPLAARGWFDTEALARDSDTLYIGIERVNRIVRFDYARGGLSARGEPIAVPSGIRNLPNNRGIEALEFAPRGGPLGGTLIAISERGLDAAGNILGFLIGGPTPGRFTVLRTDDFDITDAALTRASDLLILERHFSFGRGVGMRIRTIPLTQFKPGALLDGKILVDAGNVHEIDNMEGIAMHENAAGETIVTIVSDDNFSRLQRTLLLRFALIED